MTSVQKRRGRSGICFRGPAPAITEVVAVVKLARIADGWLDRLGPAKEVAQRAGVLACSAGGGAQVGRSVGIGARPSYSVSLLFRQSVPAARDLSFQASMVPDAEGYGVATHSRCFQCAGLSR